jgi:hypothetical protein
LHSGADPAIAPSPAFQVLFEEEEDVEMEAPATEAALGHEPPAPVDPVMQAIEALKPSPTDLALRVLVNKIKGIMSVSTIVQLIPLDFCSTASDFLKKYHTDVMHLGSVLTHFAKLCKHASNGMYPTALHLIKEPVIQWSHQILAAPQSDQIKFSGMAGVNFVRFNDIISQKTTKLKKEILGFWIQEKECELALFQKAAHASTGFKNLWIVFEGQTDEICNHFAYDVDGQPRATKANPLPANICKIIDG